MDDIKMESNITERLQQAIESTNTALSLAKSQKKLFCKNVLIAKNQIRDDIGIHLDLLRNREVWLLEQVEIHAQMREKIIQGYLDKISTLQSKLQVFDEILQNSTDDKNVEVLHHVEDFLANLGPESLLTDDAFKICFVADNFALAAALRMYGTVEASKHCTSSQSVAVTGEKKLLPRKCCHSEKNSLHRSFEYIESFPLNEWLVKCKNLETNVADGVSVFQWKTFEELKTSKHEEWLYCDSSQPTEKKITEVNKFFEQNKTSPSAEWLLKPTNVEESKDMLDNPQVIIDLPSGDINDWLVKSNKSQSSIIEDKEINDVGISFQNCNIDKTSDEESWLQGSTTPKGVAVESGTKPKKLDSDWLIKSVTSHKVVEQQEFGDGHETNASDWLITSPDPKPDYCEWLRQESIDQCKRCAGENCINAIENVFNKSQKDWLVTVTDW